MSFEICILVTFSATVMFVIRLLHVSIGAMALPVLTIVMLMTKMSSGYLKGNILNKAIKLHYQFINFLILLRQRYHNKTNAQHSHGCHLILRPSIRSSGQPQSVLARHRQVLASQISQVKAEVNSMHVFCPETNSSRIWSLSTCLVRETISFKGTQCTILAI